MSIAAPNRGILATWEDTGSVLVVPMGEVRFIAFSNTLAIGTRGLGSCSVALVVSQHGAILAHIPPLPLEPSSPPASAQSKAESDPYAGDKNVRKMMGYVKDLYNYNRSFFPTSNTHVVCALYQGEVALPDQMAIMRDVFREMGLDPVRHTYDVPGNRAIPGQGTVIATSFLDGQFPSVWVEDKLVVGDFPREQVQAAMGQDRDPPSTSSGQVTVAQQSVWSGKGKAPATWAPDLESAAQDFGLLDIAQEPASSGKGKAPWTYEKQMSTTSDQSVTAQGSVPGDNKYNQTQITQVGGPTQTGRTWREVHFRVETHLTRRDEYIFRDRRV
ncbi:hypothetical protein Daus18300_012902 [Diaporthe australafricana]|uniref:Uncharacterized protein n=1 Tax=Diaporthe australafricana TaxID=127596 RepID=A0ABR3W140_9PEZI